MNDILTVSGLNKSYGDFSLKDVTFSLPEGCITGFIGVNGAGKTTTLRTLLGLTNKLSGKIQFFGLDIDKNEREIKDRIGIVLDGGGFYEELSLGEMKVIISSAYTSWSEQDFKRYMDMFSLDPKQKINSLSKGMRMKYALALALSHNAELLIMDEPTSGLDPNQIIEIRSLIKSLGEKHTIILSSHILSEVNAVCDYVLIIDKGTLVAEDTPEHLSEDFSDTDSIILSVKGDKEKVEKVLKASEYIKDYKITGEKEDIVDVRAKTATKEDIRDNLFFEFAEEKLPIIKMERESLSLEDVFLELEEKDA